MSICLLPDTRWIAVATADHTITFYSPAYLKPQGQFIGVKSGITGGMLAIPAKGTSTNRELLAVGRGDGVLQIFAMTEDQMKTVADVSSADDEDLLNAILCEESKMLPALKDPYTNGFLNREKQAIQQEKEARRNLCPRD